MAMGPLLLKRLVPIALSCVLLFFASHSILITYFHNRSAQTLIPPAAATVAALPDHTARHLSDFAYLQYASSPASLCNAVTLFASLHEARTRADLVLVYPSPWDDQIDTQIARLLRRARKTYNIKLSPMGPDPDDSRADLTTTRLVALNQTAYKRILLLDPHSLVLEPLDDLFFLPPSAIAMTHAYWRRNQTLSLADQITLLTPSHYKYRHFHRRLAERTQAETESWTRLFEPSERLIFAHYPYLMLSAELAARGPFAHVSYLGRAAAKWDAFGELRKVRLLHFADGRMAEAESSPPPQLRERFGPPQCATDRPAHAPECGAHRAWNWAYSHYARRKAEACRPGV